MTNLLIIALLSSKLKNSNSEQSSMAFAFASVCCETKFNTCI